MNTNPQFPTDDVDDRTEEERHIYELEHCLAQTQALASKQAQDIDRLIRDLHDAWEARDRARGHAHDCQRERDLWRKSEMALAAEMAELRKLAETSMRAATQEERLLAASLVCARLVRGGPETETDLVEAAS